MVLAGGYDEARMLAEQRHLADRSQVNAAYEFARFLAFEDRDAGVAWYVDYVRNQARSPLAHYWLARLYSDLNEHSRAMSTIEDIASYAPRLPDLLNIFVFNSMYTEVLDPVENLSRLRRMVRQQFGLPLPPTGSVSKRPRYVIGFMCSSLNRHAISTFAEPILRCLDRKKFMVIVFSSNSRNDDHTEVLRRLPDFWYDVERLNDAQLLDLVRSERVDVLVDLDNHTQRNRLWVFAQRAAPIQVALYGFNTTTGLEAMDYRLTDWVVDPPGAEDSYSEKLLRTRCCHFAFADFLPMPLPSDPPTSLSGPPAFGSFNGRNKIGATQVQRWAEILANHPGSTLDVIGFDDGLAFRRLKRWLIEAGVSTDRVQVEGRIGPLDLWPRMQAVDLAIDSWPFGGAVTTALTLRLGVPLISALGPRAVSRASASAMNDLGLNDFVCEDPSALSSLASCALADRSALRRLRNEISARFADTVGRGERVANELGELLIRAIERYRKGLPAAHDSIT